MKAPKFILAVLLSSAGLSAHADTFKIDPLHSSIVFSIKYLVSDFYGRFNDLSGQVVSTRPIPPKVPSSSPFRLKASIRTMRSVTEI